MLTGFKFHHIGVAVREIASTAKVYEQGGYHCSATVFDPVQNVNVCWLTRDGFPIVELLEPVDENSPVNTTLAKMGVAPYHCCYVVDDIDAAVAELRKQRYVLIGNPAEAVAFLGSRVCFLYNKNVGLIELVEAPADMVK